MSRAAAGSGDPSGGDDERLRLDKWLWAARFFKTRSAASDAVDGGKVLVNEQRVKPAKTLKAGDLVSVRRGESQVVVRVAQLSARRGSAPVAQTLYVETEDSVKRREAQQAAGLDRHPASEMRGRPTKRTRRQLGRVLGEP